MPWSAPTASARRPTPSAPRLGPTTVIAMVTPSASCGAKVIIVEDDDAAGRRRTRQIRASLRGVAASLDVVRAASGKDAYDHVAAGLELHDLMPVIGEPVPEDDGSFAAIPMSLFVAAEALNLSHLDFRVLIEVVRHSVRREANVHAVAGDRLSLVVACEVLRQRRAAQVRASLRSTVQGRDHH